jgi:hypothetical protein
LSEEPIIQPIAFLNRKPYFNRAKNLKDKTEIEYLCEMLTENIRKRERTAKVTVKEVQDEVKKQ